MYNELSIIENIKDMKMKAKIILLFIKEYSGWLEHLNKIGGSWGAGGEECKVNNETIKTKNHIELLENKLLEIYDNFVFNKG